jgi:flavin-dependent dehydrogenase
MPSIETDVAIVGAGPGGSTCGALLKKYDPGVKISIFERETFPRDHVGESLLPMTCTVLDEMGVWDRVEACRFPIKIGATLKWGNSPELWDFNFLPWGELAPEPRPGKYEKQRRRTAFQVDRATYDAVLCDHAQSLGCDVRFRAAVREVDRDGDRITGLVLDDGSEVHAKYYVDASGHSGIIRRKMRVEIEEPSLLRNIAVWDYWRNGEWAVQLGIEGTRIQVLSIGYGWIWYIQIGDDRTSVGFVCPADYYKKTGLSVEELYTKALSEEPRVTALLANATREHQLGATKDWSFISQRMTGENWFLAGESQGFADPILSAGLTLTQASAREVAFTILEANRGTDLRWLREQYEERNSRRIRQHIRFADYWYVGNGNLHDLREYVATIASDAGLELDGEKAFKWLATGGFIEEDMEVAGIAAVRLDQMHAIGSRLSGTAPASGIDGYNVFELNLKGAENIRLARYEKGRVVSVEALRRDKKVLPLNLFFAWMVHGLSHSPSLEVALQFLRTETALQGVKYDAIFHARLMEALEAMIWDGWVERKVAHNLPKVKHRFAIETPSVRANDAGK